MKENSLFGPSYKTKAQKHRQQKTKPPKNKKADHKKHLLHFGKQPPIFGIFVFSSYTLSCLQSCVLLKTLRNSVFSREQLLYMTDRKAPFQGKTQNGTFGCKSAILGFPPCLLKPHIFVVFGDLEWAQKRPFSFSNIKKTKPKSAHFFRKPFFDTVPNCPKNIFAHLHTICVFQDAPKTL